MFHSLSMDKSQLNSDDYDYLFHFLVSKGIYARDFLNIPSPSNRDFTVKIKSDTKKHVITAIAEDEKTEIVAYKNKPMCLVSFTKKEEYKNTILVSSFEKAKLTCEIFAPATFNDLGRFKWNGSSDLAPPKIKMLLKSTSEICSEVNAINQPVSLQGNLFSPTC